MCCRAIAFHLILTLQWDLKMSQKTHHRYISRVAVYRREVSFFTSILLPLKLSYFLKLKYKLLATCADGAGRVGAHCESISDASILRDAVALGKGAWEQEVFCSPFSLSGSHLCGT